MPDKWVKSLKFVKLESLAIFFILHPQYKKYVHHSKNKPVKNNLKLLVLFCIIFNNGFSQNYEKYFANVNIADSLLYIEHDTTGYVNILSILDNKFDSQEYLLLKMYSLLGDTTNAYKQALVCFSKGFDLTVAESYFNKNILAQLKNEYQEQHLIYLKNKKISDDFIYAIHEMIGRDQLIRDLLMDSIVNEQQWIKVDTANLITLLGLIDSYGFPMQKDYGSKFHTFYVEMIHLPYLDETIYQRFLNFYKSNLINGAIEPELLAYFIDRHDYEINGEQTYGTFANPYEGVGKLFDEENIEQRRKELFLPSMKVYLTKRGVKK